MHTLKKREREMWISNCLELVLRVIIRCQDATVRVGQNSYTAPYSPEMSLLRSLHLFKNANSTRWVLTEITNNTDWNHWSLQGFTVSTVRSMNAYWGNDVSLTCDWLKKPTEGPKNSVIQTFIKIHITLL
jgi:hypothetical protein